MENLFNRMADKASRTVRHWWLYLITGILSIIAGIVVFCNPIESYLTLSIMFGILMLISGIVELVVSSTSRNYFTTRSYSIVGGILDLLIGLFLCCYPRITMVVLPVILGVWMMFHSFMIIGLGSDMDSFRVRGSGWVIAGGVILLLLSLGITLDASMSISASTTPKSSNKSRSLFCFSVESSLTLHRNKNTLPL